MYDNDYELESFLRNTLSDCRDMIKYVYTEDKDYKATLKKTKKNVKEMLKKMDEEGLRGICEG